MAMVVVVVVVVLLLTVDDSTFVCVGAAWLADEEGDATGRGAEEGSAVAVALPSEDDETEDDDVLMVRKAQICSQWLGKKREEN
jgi:hypothetical protein